MRRCDAVDLWDFERQAAEEGRRFVAGIDEAGRGPLAGPVVAAAVVLPFECEIDGVFDSKQLSEKRRDEAFGRLCETALSIGIGIVDPPDIDRINILQATYRAMRCAASGLSVSADFFLVDGYPIRDFGRPQRGIVGGDSRSISIAAASIVAKVTRDRIMRIFDNFFPEYGFAKHKGYPTSDHLERLAEFGPCEIHRRSFAHVCREGELPWETAGSL